MKFDPSVTTYVTTYVTTGNKLIINKIIYRWSVVSRFYKKYNNRYNAKILL